MNDIGQVVGWQLQRLLPLKKYSHFLHILTPVDGRHKVWFRVAQVVEVAQVVLVALMGGRRGSTGSRGGAGGRGCRGSTSGTGSTDGVGGGRTGSRDGAGGRGCTGGAGSMVGAGGTGIKVAQVVRIMVVLEVVNCNGGSINLLYVVFDCSIMALSPGHAVIVKAV